MSISAFDDKGRPLTITIGEQEALISANLNSSMLLNFLMGIYTMVYFGTLYLYFSRKGPVSQRWFVLSTITALYIICTYSFAISWFWLQRVMVADGSSRKSIFIASAVNSPSLVWFYGSQIIVSSLTVALSDGLLLWRCFHLWGGSWQVIGVPLFLTISELALMIPTAYSNVHPDSPALVILSGDLSSASMFVSAASTIITTTLIGYKIYGTTSTLTPGKSKRRFTKIFLVIFESAAIYAAVVFGNAIYPVVPYATFEYTLEIRIGSYLGALLPIAAGLAPTILVARVLTARSNDTDLASIDISGLRFQSQQVTGQNHTQLTRSGNTTRRVRITDVESGTRDVVEKSRERVDFVAIEEDPVEE